MVLSLGALCDHPKVGVVFFRRDSMSEKETPWLCDHPKVTVCARESIDGIDSVGGGNACRTLCGCIMCKSVLEICFYE